MNLGKACAIFKQIDSERFTEQEKLFAIQQVLEMPTHNSFTKAETLTAFKWLYNYTVEIEEEGEKNEHD